MDKRWYPVAFSISIVGCSGDVDDGKPAATGGMPANFYGVMITGGSAGSPNTGRAFYGVLATGGRTQVDTGTPSSTGGMTPVPPYGVQPVGGAPAGGGGGAAGTQPSGGRAGIDTGTPTQIGGQVTTDYGVLRNTGGRD
jgi:hypothetical protein